MRKYLVLLPALLAYPAMAADVPAYRTNGINVPAAYKWDGLYAGFQAGYSFNADVIHPFGNIGGDSWLLGGFVGLNRQYGNWVLGLETDYNYSDLNGTNNFGPITATHQIDQFGSTRARLGYAWSNYMLYGTGGLAYGHGEATVGVPGFNTGANAWHVGWSAGAGLEAMYGGFLWRAEYRYYDLGSADYGFPIAGPIGISLPADITFHTVTLGVGIELLS